MEEDEEARVEAEALTRANEPRQPPFLERMRAYRKYGRDRAEWLETKRAEQLSLLLGFRDQHRQSLEQLHLAQGLKMPDEQVAHFQRAVDRSALQVTHSEALQAFLNSERDRFWGDQRFTLSTTVSVLAVFFSLVSLTVSILVAIYK